MEIHEQLNQKIFDGDKLKPSIRDRIIDIVDEFVDNLWVKIKVLDIQLLGSNASYNYTPNSDIDVHIITNFEFIDAPQEVVTALYNLEKTSFNKNYDITIKGLPVEIYVEDVGTGAVSNGIYSVTKDKWVKYPKKITNVPQYDLSDQVSKWRKIISSQIINDDREGLKETLDTLYIIRKNSIAVDGEYGKGNMLFKELRNLGFIDQIKDKIREVISKELSVESMKENLFITDMLKMDME